VTGAVGLDAIKLELTEFSALTVTVIRAVLSCDPRT
jgi:hypothetical protein